MSIALRLGAGEQFSVAQTRATSLLLWPNSSAMP